MLANHALQDALAVPPIPVMLAEMLVNLKTQLPMYVNHAQQPIVLFALVLLTNVIQMDAKLDSS